MWDTALELPKSTPRAFPGARRRLGHRSAGDIVYARGPQRPHATGRIECGENRARLGHPCRGRQRQSIIRRAGLPLSPGVDLQSSTVFTVQPQPHPHRRPWPARARTEGLPRDCPGTAQGRFSGPREWGESRPPPPTDSSVTCPTAVGMSQLASLAPLPSPAPYDVIDRTLGSAMVASGSGLEPWLPWQLPRRRESLIPHLLRGRDSLLEIPQHRGLQRWRRSS